METFEETALLSPKETIVNILGRLFNNGHITSDELSLMQTELLTRNPAPVTEPDHSIEEMREFMNRMLQQNVDDSKTRMLHVADIERMRQNPYREVSGISGGIYPSNLLGGIGGINIHTGDALPEFKTYGSINLK